MQGHRSRLVVPLFFAACLLLGGSPQGIWRHLFLTLGGLSLLAWTLASRRRADEAPRDAVIVVMFAGCWLALLLLQLIPLPPAIWTLLPGRELAVEGFVATGAELPWLPMSMTPAETAAQLPLIAVPLGLFAAMIWQRRVELRLLLAALFGCSFISICLGLLQQTEGGPYLYPIVNIGKATGLFANSNHQGTLLLVTIPFLAALVPAVRARRKSSERKRNSRLLLIAGAIGLVVAAILLNRSLASLVLLGPVVLASTILVWPGRLAERWAVAGFVALLLAAAAWVAGPGASDQSIAERADIYARTLKAIAASFPFGTGIGSFTTVYPFFEDSAVVGRTFVNHAHSDPPELLLEAGMIGLLLMAAFIVWWVRLTTRLWTAHSGDRWALAASIACGTMIAHSLVDYPLRDPALQAVFAVALALMVGRRPKQRPAQAGRPARHLELENDAPPSA